MSFNLTMYEFYEKIAGAGHVLVAGKAGSGKSVILNGLIVTAIANDADLMLLDPKGGVEFGIYRDALNVKGYAGDIEEFAKPLKQAIAIMDERFKRMEEQRIRKSKEKPLYVVIDEYADMMSEKKKELQPLLLKLARKGRAANVRLILATQTPYKSIITGDIKANMQTLVALKVLSKSYSRLIIDEPGAENLHVGEALVRLDSDDEPHKEIVPMYDDETLETVALLRTPPAKRWKEVSA